MRYEYHHPSNPTRTIFRSFRFGQAPRTVEHEGEEWLLCISRGASICVKGPDPYNNDSGYDMAPPGTTVSMNSMIGQADVPEMQQELARRGCPTEYIPVDETFAVPVLTDRKHRKSFHELTGVYDKDAGYSDATPGNHDRHIKPEDCSGNTGD